MKTRFGEGPDIGGLTEAYASYLGTMEWDYYVTLTFRYPVGSDFALRCAKQWVRRLEQRAQGPVDHFAKCEKGRSALNHIHALVAGPESLTRDHLRSMDLGPHRR